MTPPIWTNCGFFKLRPAAGDAPFSLEKLRTRDRRSTSCGGLEAIVRQPDRASDGRRSTMGRAEPAQALNMEDAERILRAIACPRRLQIFSYF